MKSRLLPIAVGVLSIFMVSSVAYAQVPSNSPMVEGPHFRFGESVVVTEDLAGDVFVAGSTVRVDGNVTGDLMVAGGQVVINGDVSDDLRVAGGNVTINGRVGKNVSVAGGSVLLSQSSQVNQSLIGGAGTINLSGPVLGTVWVGSGDANVETAIGQDLHVYADKVSLMPEAMVGGNADLKISENGLVRDDASIAGEKNVEFVVDDQDKEKIAKTTSGALTGAAVSGWVMSVLMGLVGGALALYFFAHQLHSVARQVVVSPMGSLGWGFVGLITVPILAILLMVTVVGLPLGFILLLMYIIGLMIAGWVSAYAVGQVVYTKLKVEALKNPYLQLLVGLVAISLIGLIPVIGWAAAGAAYLMGFGALVAAAKTAMSRPRK